MNYKKKGLIVEVPMHLFIVGIRARPLRVHIFSGVHNSKYELLNKFCCVIGVALVTF